MNCIIVDDEYPAREELKYFIREFSDIEILEEFDSPLEALKYIEKQNVDVIFLDISMPGLDGISLGRIISRFEEKPKIVFITAYREHAIDAFEIDAFDYILKPYSKERIIGLLKKLQKSSAKASGESIEKITLWKDEKIIVLDIGDIYYCEASERNTIVHSKDESYIENTSISDFYKRLPKDRFFRTHRSYIVNLDKIKEIIPWFNNTYNIRLKDDVGEVPVSRSNIKDFRKIMGI
ncbi:two component transcriptional regulator, LytTR family [Peptoclostridium litorale DSM 5388]|uniref:Stage 0 sporulation protein A homolog n=1 Tax=Peptoclostridium litorale DSM 5388 TaxID=1121324 RepID=A0A069RC20_PEPLI|nr:LytTR family DNA-binding domain-containing protein [Peptoclostridium litorale]KDR93805.1 response regulator receiver domain-containing protein [Peptoclostridium litorale DSM 5388]SIN86184.1 two component transcriptional regulator, LytTR family [Peptoclostridium litorale DSM 5388]